MLVIFDIDGTLIRSTHVDDACFRAALGGTLGVHDFDTDWANYEHSTDDGLIIEIARRYGGFEATPRQVEDAKGEFFAQLRQAAARDRAMCTLVEGACEMLAHVRGQAGWSVGISSGTSDEAARIKLAAAGLSLEGLPATFSHRRGCEKTGEPARRSHIIARTREKLVEAGGPAGVEGGARPTVYVGDGLWDLRAAAELGIGFIGVRHDGREEALRSHGARRIVRDYRDLPAFIAMLEEAAA